MAEKRKRFLYLLKTSQKFFNIHSTKQNSPFSLEFKLRIKVRKIQYDKLKADRINFRLLVVNLDLKIVFIHHFM